jgi:hypothetical protein
MGRKRKKGSRGIGRHQKCKHTTQGRIKQVESPRTRMKRVATKKSADTFRLPKKSSANMVSLLKEKSAGSPDDCDDVFRAGESEIRVSWGVYIKKNLQSPPEADWDGPTGAISKLMQVFNVPRGSRNAVRNVFERLKADPNGDLSRRRQYARKAKRKIELGTEAADMMMAFLPTHSVRDVAHIVSEEMGVGVSASTIQRTYKRPEYEVWTNKRSTRPQGSKEKHKAWLQCRVELCKQLQDQLKRGRARRRPNAKKADKSKAPALLMDAILFADEMHSQCVIGGSGHNGTTGKLERRFPLDQQGKHCSTSNGGVRPPSKPTVKPKFSKEMRGCFAVCTPKIAGKRTAKRCKPFPYTGTTVIGITTFEKKVALEVRRVKKMQGVWKNHSNAENPYLSRYGAGWREYALKNRGGLCSQFTCISDISDHLIAEGNKAFKGSTAEGSWFLYHDALSSWNEKKHLSRLKHLGFENRLICCVGDTMKGTRYEGKLPGDSPELMPLDNSLFNDLHQQTAQNVSATYRLQFSDPKKFSYQTPLSAWSAVTRTWTQHPSDQRIIADIDRFPQMVDQILENDGDQLSSVNRSGHRKQRKVYTNDNELWSSQLHPDAQTAFDEMRLVIKTGVIHTDIATTLSTPN